MIAIGSRVCLTAVLFLSGASAMFAQDAFDRERDKRLKELTDATTRGGQWFRFAELTVEIRAEFGLIKYYERLLKKQPLVSTLTEKKWKREQARAKNRAGILCSLVACNLMKLSMGMSQNDP